MNDVTRILEGLRDGDRQGALERLTRCSTLREVARTAPYMHDGSIATLEDVVDFYDRGGNVNPYRDANVRTLGLTAAEKRALVAFLRALGGTVTEGVPRQLSERDDDEQDRQAGDRPRG